jgi:beta-lactamase regulating signal transducer with metallopeptidase domain
MHTEHESVTICTMLVRALQGGDWSVDDLANPPITESQKLTDRTPEKARTKDTPTEKSSTTNTVSVGIGLAYERFLRLPVTVVLLVMWVVGIVFFGSCVLVIYLYVSVLVRMVVGP